MALQTRIYLPATALTAALAFAGALAVASQASAAAASPAGVWINDTGRGAVEIKPCGSGFCGHVVWVKAGADASGCGKQIIGDVKSAGGGTWDGGWIYSPERGKRYNAELEPLSDGTLKVTGYAGVRFLSKTMIWTRAPGSLVRCDAKSSAEAPAPAPVAAVKTAQPAAQAPAVAVAGDETAASEAPAEAVEAVGETTGKPKRVSRLDDGIEVGDVFSMKKAGEGKCRIKTPWVDLTVDCEKRR